MKTIRMKQTALIACMTVALAACGGGTTDETVPETGAALPDTAAGGDVEQTGGATDTTASGNSITDVAAASGSGSDLSTDSTITTTPIATTDAAISTDTTPMEIPTELLAALPQEPVATNTLTVEEEFDFSTSRSIDVDFDLDDARDQPGDVSICTSWDPSDGALGIDYDSCLIEGELVEGRFSHSMEVTNDVNSVVAVIWFEDIGLDPMMQEFGVSVTSRSKSAGKRTLVWR